MRSGLGEEHQRCLRSWRIEETLLRRHMTYGEDVLGMATEVRGGPGLGRRRYSVGGKKWSEHRGTSLHPTLLVLDESGQAV
jgi:hypothetical protein